MHKTNCMHSIGKMSTCDVFSSTCLSLVYIILRVTYYFIVWCGVAWRLLFCQCSEITEPE